MQMVYCRACGKQIEAAAHFCAHCGAKQGMAAAAPMTTAPAAASVRPEIPGAAASTEEIDALVWQARFALIEKAGGAKLKKIWTLPVKEIFRIRWNTWAFLFGPFYYASKGIWKKGVTLSALGLLIAIGGGIILDALGLDPDMLVLLPASILCGQANVSYYRKVREGFSGWW